MNIRVILIVGSAVVCFATVTGVLVRGRQLGDLRAEQRLLFSQQEAPIEISSQPTAVQNTPGKAEQRSPGSPSLELLRLRSEVNRLTNRRRELEGVAKESERLRSQRVISGTDASAATPLPPGYIRKSAARMAGYNTPEETLETMLWSLQNRDFTNLVQAFTPEAARQLQKEVEKAGSSPEDFFNSEGLPGMRVLGREQATDGSIELLGPQQA